jgi:hypothetical protein
LLNFPCVALGRQVTKHNKRHQPWVYLLFSLFLSLVGSTCKRREIREESDVIFNLIPHFLYKRRSPYGTICLWNVHQQCFFNKNFVLLSWPKEDKLTNKPMQVVFNLAPHFLRNDHQLLKLQVYFLGQKTSMTVPYFYLCCSILIFMDMVTRGNVVPAV